MVSPGFAACVEEVRSRWLHSIEQKRSAGTPIRAMPTSQNRDVGHPDLCLASSCLFVIGEAAKVVSAGSSDWGSDFR